MKLNELYIGKREFKFRFWNPETKRFIQDDEDYAGRGWRIGDFALNPYGIVQFFEQTEGGMSVSDHNNIVITQAIGMEDRNGKEIYEGDVVLYTSDKYFEKPTECIVFFNQEAFEYRIMAIEQIVKGFNFESQLRYIDEIEVIGNVFQNAEFFTK